MCTHEATPGWVMSPQTSPSAAALSPEGPQGRTQWSLQAWPPATWQAKGLQPPPWHNSSKGALPTCLQSGDGEGNHGLSEGSLGDQEVGTE